ncbi:hypothetical protein CIPAW_02G132800 [Carya illinoinensis]|uniref:Uncharacterized protein n=1 Tax=Carya illinoinensis TaxID=32201 RepID=A0A8T1REI7_CARIL|nr:hypothetical protein CIPAW_02G132800 [Carya illinoinensis]
MAKLVKLTKLKSAIKRWPSFTKLARTTSSVAAANESDEASKDQLHAVYVVLFEHLLWMLENAETQMGSTDELVEFYSTTC